MKTFRSVERLSSFDIPSEQPPQGQGGEQKSDIIHFGTMCRGLFLKYKGTLRPNCLFVSFTYKGKISARSTLSLPSTLEEQTNWNMIL